MGPETGMAWGGRLVGCWRTEMTPALPLDGPANRLPMRATRTRQLASPAERVAACLPAVRARPAPVSVGSIGLWLEPGTAAGRRAHRTTSSYGCGGGWRLSATGLVAGSPCVDASCLPKSYGLGQSGGSRLVRSLPGLPVPGPDLTHTQPCIRRHWRRCKRCEMPQENGTK